MLALQKQSQYIKKQVRLPNGSLALVVFELVHANGKVTAKAVYGQILDEVKVQETGDVLTLPVYFETEHVLPVASPFFLQIADILKDLSFVISQPSRAPSFS